MRRFELLEAGRRYLSTGEKPQNPYRYGTCPMDPVNQQYEEMLFDPRDFGRRLEGMGFRCRV